MDRIRGVSRVVQETAWQLRREMNPAERQLWAALRLKQLDGMRFRKQHPLGRFVLDFYCPYHRLVVEVHGSIHDARSEADADRTQVLESYGIRVVRFRNEEVLTNLPSVLERIRLAASELSAVERAYAG